MTEHYLKPGRATGKRFAVPSSQLDGNVTTNHPVVFEVGGYDLMRHMYAVRDVAADEWRYFNAEFVEDRIPAFGATDGER